MIIKAIDMWAKLFMFLFALLTIPSANAADINKKLFGDIAFMYGDIQQVSVIEELCSEQFPSTMGQNMAAVKGWKERNKKLIAEIEGRFADNLVAMSNGDPERHGKLLAHFNKSHEDAKKKLKEMLISGGATNFRKQCEGYPKYLDGPEMNMESSRKDILQAIRTTK